MKRIEIVVNWCVTALHLYQVDLTFLAKINAVFLL